MPQIHIKLKSITHKKLLKKAKEFNYSIQEFVERSLMTVAEESQPYFAFRRPESEDKDYKFTFTDLFAGIGGIRLAFEEHGGKCVFSSELDRWCQRTYFENFAELPVGDINKISADEIPDHDILTAGFPCQPFSIAGVSKKKSLGREHGFKDETQGTLFFRIADILERKRPKAFLLENVKNLKNHDSGNTYRVIEGTLKKLGYHIFADVLDAVHYVPQHRERLFIIGFDQKVFSDAPSFHFPVPPKKKVVLGNILQKKADKKYILSNHLWQYLQNYAEKHRQKGNGFGYGLFDRNDIARTLSARYYKDGSEILIKVPNSNPRRLTPKECARLMGFGDNFKIPVSDTQAYKQFGNSVAVPVVSAVAAKLVKVLLPDN